MNIYFLPSELDWDKGILMSKSIVINRHSSQTTIRKFINERLYILEERYNLEDIVNQSDVVGPMIEYHYSKIHII